MINSPQLTPQTRVSKVLQVSAAIFSMVGVSWIFAPPFLGGNPTQITCQNVDLIRIDCTVKYRALLRSSAQEIKNVETLRVDERSSLAGSSEYVAVLQTKNGDRSLKTYSYANDPELQDLNNRFTKFINDPKEKLTISLAYSRWGAVFDRWGAIFNAAIFLGSPLVFLLVSFIVLYLGSLIFFLVVSHSFSSLLIQFSKINTSIRRLSDFQSHQKK